MPPYCSLASLARFNGNRGGYRGIEEKSRRVLVNKTQKGGGYKTSRSVLSIISRLSRVSATLRYAPMNDFVALDNAWIIRV